MLPQVLDGWDKFTTQVEALQGGTDEFIRRELLAFPDYLSLYFQTGDEDYKSLYIGEKRKQFYDAKLDAEARAAVESRILEADAAALRAGLADAVDSEALALLDATLDDIRRVITTWGGRKLDVLLIGDCVHLDVLAFLMAPCLEDQVSLETTFVTSKNPVERQAQLKALADRRFDVVFFSPYTYEFQPEYNALHKVRRARIRADKVHQIAEAAAERTESDLNLVSTLFECPIFVHNSANVRRRDQSLALTRGVRRRAAAVVNTRLRAYVAARNTATFTHLFVLDEEALLAQYGDDELGRTFYNSDLQHPAVLGKHLAGLYRDILAVRAHLLSRKLVVCDLDNTLWRGEIGEGRIEHYLDRQQTLKRLRQKGVVLAVNSKNDPRNVHWDGAALNEDDFVNRQINWDHKVVNMKRIREALNLKFKDYVFVDDRGDQLALVAASMPEIHGMDASLERTWRLMALWADLLPEQDEADRTQQYRERGLRDQFLATVAPEVDPVAMFAQLGLRMTLREARRSDFKRVVELINRTNQFNLAGSRSTFREIEAWAASPRSKILVADGADKFGAMGLVCVAVVEHGEQNVRIPIFILSCRVFGYGFETAMLNAIVRTVQVGSLSQPPAIVGAFRETSHNQPCRQMYPDYGFRWDDTAWVLDGEPRPDPQDPAWLTITSELPTPALHP
jgi:FkbH-like protein